MSKRQKKRSYSEVEFNCFYRTCQECDHHQYDQDLRGKPTSWEYDNGACKHCGSEALDYGTVKVPFVPDIDDDVNDI